MNRRNPLAHRGALLLLLPLLLAGCAGMGSLDDLLGGLGGDLAGEIRRVDERRRQIQLRTDYGRTETVDYDRDTRVEYRRERYPVRALEAGDEVSIRLRRGRAGDAYADYIRVHRSVRDRYPSSSRDRDRDRDWEGDREQTLQGRVERIDRRAGWFRLRDDRSVWLVTLPQRPASALVSRFRALRSGDRVRIDGRLLQRDRVELRRIR